MNILVAHNFYQVRGGEDQIFHDTADLLESHGHRVTRFAVHNDDLKNTGKLAMAKMTIWNRAIARQIRDIVLRDRIEVAHFINTFPQISPAAYFAARGAGAVVVQELQNFRLSCPSALFLRDGKVCESCMGKLIPWPAILHGCYRDSKSASAVVASMLTAHRLLGTYNKAVDAYIANTEFGRNKLIEAGLPAHKLYVKPNFVSPAPAPGAGDGDFALFVGRLSKEKGIETLLRAWQQLPSIKLLIVGDGPMAQEVKVASSMHPGITWVGRKSGPEVLDLMGQARLLVFPSIWYEGLPKTIIESLAKGTPIVASKIGAMIELIDPGRTGFHVPPGNAAALAEAVQSLYEDRATQSAMRRAARSAFESRYTAETNYRQLLAIYANARPAPALEDDSEAIEASIKG